jgi:ABC-type Fe3+/spermidine/putrescine transport system ATPase subunit
MQDGRESGLSISELTVRYGQTVALDRLALTVRPAELFVLLGGSGSGKSTLLRAIAGLVRPEAGRIALDGTDLSGLPPHRRPVNTMFQSYALFPHMSVAANIGFGLRQLGMGRAATERRVAEMLALVRLDGFGGRRPHQLSGGQQQRVALARSLAPHPRLLLLDEPLSALDRNLRAGTREELLRLQRVLATSFILVTHDQEEALAMADRIGVMQAGRMVQVGTPAELYERPNCRFVAEFLGSANLLPVDVEPGGAVVRLAGGMGVRLACPAPAGRGLLAIRPERLRIGAPAALNRLEGVVEARLYAGETLTWAVRLPDGTALRVTETLRDGLRPELPAAGDPVVVSWMPDAGIVLPA